MIETVLFLLFVIICLQSYLLHLGIKTQGEIVLMREYLAMIQAEVTPQDKQPSPELPERMKENVTVHVFDTSGEKPPSGELISSLKGYGNE